MSKEQTIRAWKNKKLSASLGATSRSVPAHPAGSSGVSLQDLESGNFLTSPVSICSLPPRCQCGD
jgi:mersacidin/lichenicidin family type 2 lantibiotic